MTPMWKPRDLGVVVAERRLVFRRSGSSSKPVRVAFGRPVRSPHVRHGDPWWCPVQITGLGSRKMTSIAGEDSLQALVLALEYVTRSLPAAARRAGGHIEWLGERERLVFASTFLLEMYENALSNVIEGIKGAIPLLENPERDRGNIRRRVLLRLKTLDSNWGFEKRRRRS